MNAVIKVEVVTHKHSILLICLCWKVDILTDWQQRVTNILCKKIIKKLWSLKHPGRKKMSIYIIWPLTAEDFINLIKCNETWKVKEIIYKEAMVKILLEAI